MNSKKAFTLLEIVVSLAILALGVLGVFSLIPTGIDQSKKGQEQAKGILLAQAKMEEIIASASEDWENFYTNSHDFEDVAHFPPYFIGPNSFQERNTWGWVIRQLDAAVKENSTYVPYIGYQWEWHFNSAITSATANNKTALITLTVSWPQTMSNYSGSSSDYKNVFGNESNLEDYTLGSNSLNPDRLDIQFVRLVSYVSKGI